MGEDPRVSRFSDQGTELLQIDRSNRHLGDERMVGATVDLSW